MSAEKKKHQGLLCYLSVTIQIIEAMTANNSQTADNGRPKFALVRQNPNRSCMSCPVILMTINIILQNLHVMNM